MNIRKQLNREILKIAVPNILGNITIPLLGIVDTVLMAHKGSQANVLIGAIALGGLIFNALYWNLSFLRQTTTGITAQALGAKDKRKQASTLIRAVSIGLGLALVILLLHSFIERLGFDILSNEENQSSIDYAKAYFRVRIWAIPAVLVLFALQGWFYGMQNAIIPFTLTTVLNVTNIAVSIYCVRSLGMDADGVALGTVIAQYISLVLGLILLFVRYRWITEYIGSKMQKNLNQLSEFFGLSGFVLGRNLMLFAVFSTFTYYSSTLGEAYFAANQVLLQLFFLLSFAIDGFAYASEALTGKYKGAKKPSKLKLSIRLSLYWGIGFGLLFAIVYQVYGVQILSLISPDPALVELARPYLIWLSLIAIFGAIAFIWDGVFIGATLAIPMFICMTLSTISFFITLYAIKPSQAHLAIWIAMLVYVTVRGLVQWAYFVQLWKKSRVI